MGVQIRTSIIFLGTAGDPFVVSRQLRASGGIIIQIGENQFHIDPGPGSLVMAKQCGVNLRENTAVLVSNNKLYHANDVNAVIDAMTYSGFDKKGVLIANKSVVNGTERSPASLSPFYRDCLERFVVLHEGQRVGINEIEIVALKTSNLEKNTIGFKFITPMFTLSYSSDTNYSKQLIEEYKNSNILILNIGAPRKSDSGNTLSSGDAVKIIKEVNPRLAIITHFGIKMLESDPLYEVREIQKQTGVQTIAAKDGLVINPTSYAATEGQRTLQPYPKGAGEEFSAGVEEAPVEGSTEQTKLEGEEPREVETREAETSGQEAKETPQNVEGEPSKERLEKEESLKDIFLESKD